MHLFCAKGVQHLFRNIRAFFLSFFFSFFSGGLDQICESICHNAFFPSMRISTYCLCAIFGEISGWYSICIEFAKICSSDQIFTVCMDSRKTCRLKKALSSCNISSSRSCSGWTLLCSTLIEYLLSHISKAPSSFSCPVMDAFARTTGSPRLLRGEGLERGPQEAVKAPGKISFSPLSYA